MSKAKKSPAVTVEPENILEETQVTETAETIEAAEESESSAVTVEVPAVTSTVISSSATPAEEDTRLVKVLVKYPEEYKGRRILKDGKEYSVSPESAAVFIKKGIASKI